MHELSVARNLIELACDHARQQGADRVRRIRVRLGVVSGLRKPLYFCFAAASRGTMCEDAVLEVEEIPLTVLCPRCQEVRVPHTHYSFRCPTCGSPTPKVVTGREMQLVSLELEALAGDDPTPSPAPRRAGGKPHSAEQERR